MSSLITDGCVHTADATELDSRVARRRCVLGFICLRTDSRPSDSAAEGLVLDVLNKALIKMGRITGRMNF